MLFPLGPTRPRFKAVWGCEKDEFHFDQPEIVGGFKEDCHKGKDGQKPVNGHFTQIVLALEHDARLRRAKCPMKDAQGNIHQGTHWVCRYLPGGNDPGALKPERPKAPVRAIVPLEIRDACLRAAWLRSVATAAARPASAGAGRFCRRISTPSAGASAGQPSTPTCPRDRPVGTPPNCCPQGTTFDGSVCRAPTRLSPVCAGDRPVGTPPNCCPSGTHFARGVCRRDGGGTSGPRQTPVCSGNRPVGTPPNCCPVGYAL